MSDIPEVTTAPPGFVHRKAGHCASGALRDLLEHHGLSYSGEPISEGMVFGLAGGLGFGYGQFPELDPPIVMLGRTGTLEEDFCTNLRLDFSLAETDDPDDGWALLRTELDGDRPRLIWTDIKYLDYRQVRMHNTHHAVIATGYDEGAGVAFIADSDFDELQRCSLEALAKARDSKAFPFGPAQHGTWLIDFPAALPDPRDAIARGVERALANMAAPDDERTGLPGVRAFGEGYPRWPEHFGEALPKVLKRLEVYIARAGTGGAMFRSLHAEFLTEAGELLDDSRLASAAQLYDRLSDSWRRLAQVARDGEAIDAHRAGLEPVAQIVDLETAGIDAMQDWLVRAA